MYDVIFQILSSLAELLPRLPLLFLIQPPERQPIHLQCFAPIDPDQADAVRERRG